MMTMLIAGGLVVDGTGSPGRLADVRIEDDQVAEIGPPGSLGGHPRIEAAGLVVAPGFIDPHVHLDAMLLAEPGYPGGLAQGISTVVLGSDGCGYAPASAATLDHFRSTTAGFAGNPPGIGWDWGTVGDYLARFDGPGRVAPNVAYLVPFGALRAEAVGLTARPASAAEIDRMAALAVEGMADGAVGFSFGHPYPPNTYASGAETAAVARAIGRDAVFATHMRDYEHEIEASFEEAFAVGRSSGIRVHVSHLNMRADAGIGPIERARAAGIAATFDIYPYLAGSTVLTRQLPAWVLEDGVDATLRRLSDQGVRARLRSWIEAPERRWESILLGSIAYEPDRRLQGRPPVAAAQEAGAELTDFLCDLLVASRLEVGMLAFRHHRQAEPDLRILFAHEAAVAASDGIFVGDNPHPRGFGSFARILGRFVREEGAVTLEAAIERMTGRTAQIFGLRDRGRLVPGAVADVVLFDPATIIDHATYEHGRVTATGVEALFVGGRAAVLGGRPTGDLPGRVIRGPRATRN